MCGPQRRALGEPLLGGHKNSLSGEVDEEEGKGGYEVSGYLRTTLITSWPSRARISRSGAPSPSMSGTWSRGLKMEAFPPKLLEWLHRVSPKTKHTVAPNPLLDRQMVDAREGAHPWDPEATKTQECVQVA